MSNNPETQRVVDALAAHRGLWVRTFAPMRRALAGSWIVRSENAGLHLSLDAEGRFTLDNESAGLKFDGHYAIAKVESSLYLVLDSHSVCYVLRIEDLHSTSMKLIWADDSMAPVWLERNLSPELASVNLRLL